jgi:hypothetical protein
MIKVKAAVWVPSTLLTEMVGRLEGVVQTGREIHRRSLKLAAGVT